MNYLAHAYLSFNDSKILVGNMISDFVKGKKKFDYPSRIQIGIELHRFIDSFTDAHAATKKAKIFFQPYVRLYSGAFVDVVYDHFLANDKNEFDEGALNLFSKTTYKMLDHNKEYFPEKFAQYFPYMQSQDWLYHYQFKQGIEKSMIGLVRRAKYLESSEKCYEIFLENYNALNECYNLFFSDVKKNARDYLYKLLKP